MSESCRGTLVMHDLPDVECAECTDDSCVDCRLARHALVIPCADVDGGCPWCGVEVPGPREEHRAA